MSECTSVITSAPPSTLYLQSLPIVLLWTPNFYHSPIMMLGWHDMIPEAVKWCQDVMIWCHYDLIWCQEVMILCQVMIGCQEVVICCQDVMMWCKDGARMMQGWYDMMPYSHDKFYDTRRCDMMPPLPQNTPTKCQNPSDDDSCVTVEIYNGEN